MSSENITMLVWYLSSGLAICVILLAGYFVSDLNRGKDDGSEVAKRNRRHIAAIMSLVCGIVFIDGLLLLLNCLSAYHLF